MLTGGMEAGGDRMEDNGTLLRAAKGKLNHSGLGAVEFFM